MDVNTFVFLIMKAALLAAPLFVAVLLITGMCGRWISPWLRQVMWSLVLVRLLLPISINSPISFERGYIWLFSSQPVVQPTRDAFDLELSISQGVMAGPVHTAAEQQPIATATHWFYWLEGVLEWSLPKLLLPGMFITAVWIVVTTVRLNRWVRRSTIGTQEAWLALLSEGKEKLKVNCTVQLRIVSDLRTPATHGWWRPTILLPPSALAWSEAEMRHVLWHELAHIRRNDVLANWLLAVTRVLHWWNPLFWWSQRAWLAERELACDALVLQNLEAGGVRAYGETLLKFLECISNKDANLPTTALGFVLFMGPKQVVRRRLEELGRHVQPVKKWRVCVTFVIVALLAVAGITNAAAEVPPPKNTPPLELPVGTAWQIVRPKDTRRDEARQLRAYDVTRAIKRLQEDDRQLDDSTAGLNLQVTIDHLLLGSETGKVAQGIQRDPTSKDEKPSSKCVLQENQLVVNASPAEHEEVARLLKLWSEAGQQQVSISARLISTTLSLRDMLPSKGGAVLSGGVSGIPGSIKNDGSGIAAKAWTEHAVSAFVQVLDPLQTDTLLKHLQADARSNIISAPKVTVFDGISAVVQVETQRPFVTGLTSVHGENTTVHQPHIAIVSEGFLLKVQTAMQRDKKATDLFVNFQMTEVQSVDTLTTENVPGSGVAIQIPHVSRFVVSTNSSIPDGHSLLVVPLERNQKRELQLCLLQPVVLP